MSFMRYTIVFISTGISISCGISIIIAWYQLYYGCPEYWFSKQYQDVNWYDVAPDDEKFKGVAFRLGYGIFLVQNVPTGFG